MFWIHATMIVKGMANSAIWIEEPTATPRAKSCGRDRNRDGGEALGGGIQYWLGAFGRCDVRHYFPVRRVRVTHHLVLHGHLLISSSTIY